jgi:mannosyltransferase OCH1-like enzyme
MRDCMRTWREHNPDFEIMRWDESNVPDDPFVHRALEAGQWSRASNAVRMHALATHGGVYLDTDVEVVRPFAPLLDLESFLGFQYFPDGTPQKPFEMSVCGAIAGAMPGHPLINKFLAEIPRHIEGPAAFDIIGPQMLTAVLIREGLLQYSSTPVRIGGATIFPKEVFYPYFYREQRPATVGPETIAIHLWAKRW